MSLKFVGDLHGKMIEFCSLIERRTEPDDTVIAVGDIGFGFTDIPKFPDRVKFIRGNHDSPKEALAHPNYLGEYGYWPKHRLFYIGGAWSIDYAWRQQYNKIHYPEKVWWEDEELSQGQLDAAIRLYSETKPEIVVSHEAPASIVPHILSKVQLDFSTSPMVNVEWEKYRDESTYNRPEKLECIKTRTSTALQAMLDIWRPRLWVVGHYHIGKFVDTGSTLFKCCGELELFTVPEKL